MTRFEHLASTKTTESACSRCGAPTLVALVDGLTEHIEAQALDGPAAEFAALLAGRTTFQVTLGKFLIPRDADQISAHPQASPIHAGHLCGARPQQTSIFDLEGMR